MALQKQTISENMVQVGVMGNQKNVPQTIEWTIEHHKLFVDLLLQSGGFEKVRAFILKRMMKTVKGLTWSAALDHSRQLEQLQKQTQSVLLRRPPRKPSCKLSVLVDDLVRDLEGLIMERKLSTWTLEHHKHVVDALAKVGGLDMANPMEKTAVRVLRLMEEERRQGLTARMVTKHLIGLRYLQRRTQEAIVKAAENKAKHGCSVRRPKKVKVGRKKNNNRPAECHGLSNHTLA